jgi:hypothetical protein
MTAAELLAIANRLLYDCRDPVTGEPLYPGQSSYACVEDVEAAARYLRDCAEAEPVATVRVHDTGGNAGIAWTGVPTDNSGVMRGGTPLYTHPQPQRTPVRAVTQCRCTLAQRLVGDGCEVCNPQLAQRLAAEAQADAVEALRELVDALDGAFISSWQSTAAWQTQLDRARAALATQGGGNAE